jgi:hypothetical protein
MPDIKDFFISSLLFRIVRDSGSFLPRRTANIGHCRQGAVAIDLRGNICHSIAGSPLFLLDPASEAMEITGKSA